MKLSKNTNPLIHKENIEKTEDAFGPQDVANEIEAEESCAPLDHVLFIIVCLYF